MLVFSNGYESLRSLQRFLSNLEGTSNYREINDKKQKAKDENVKVILQFARSEDLRTCLEHLKKDSFRGVSLVRYLTWKNDGKKRVDITNTKKSEDVQSKKGRQRTKLNAYAPPFIPSSKTSKQPSMACVDVSKAAESLDKRMKPEKNDKKIPTPTVQVVEVNPTKTNLETAKTVVSVKENAPKKACSSFRDGPKVVSPTDISAEPTITPPKEEKKLQRQA